MAAAFFPTNSVTISISNQSVSDSEIGVSAAATYKIGSDGIIRDQTNAVLETWLNGPGAVASNFEARATLTSGNTPTGDTLSTWLSCGTNRSWTLTQIVVGSKTCTLTIEIRDAASPNAVRDTATITIEADRSS